MRPISLVAALPLAALSLAVLGPAVVLAQPADPVLQRPGMNVVITSGTGQLIQLPSPAAAVVAADPRVARVQPLSPTSLFVMGVTPGRTTVLATAEDGVPVAQLDVTVRADRPLVAEPAAGAAAPEPKLTAAQVQAALRQALRGARAIVVSGTPNGLVLSGTAPSAAEAEQAVALVRAIAGDKQPAVNRMTVPASIQVNVRVRIAEISRTITRELGFNWQALGQIAGSSFGLTTASTVAALTGGGGRLSGRGTGRGYDINGIVDALAQDELITILAEPNLTTLSGETASFLAGGEFPIPVNGSSSNGSTQITLAFKQFGVSLSFTPTVLSPDRLNMRIRPEVSQLSTVGAVSLPLATGVITIPSLTVRRADTTVELGSGQSFAIAGLLQRTTSQSDAGTLGLSEIPVLGALFRSDRFNRAETELVIIVTPYLVHPTSPAGARAPTDGFSPATDLDRILMQRQIAQGGSPRPPVPLNAGFILD